MDWFDILYFCILLVAIAFFRYGFRGKAEVETTALKEFVEAIGVVLLAGCLTAIVRAFL
jgi:cbb3-type cytochrome oxidase subunit 3